MANPQQPHVFELKHLKHQRTVKRRRKTTNPDRYPVEAAKGVVFQTIKSRTRQRPRCNYPWLRIVSSSQGTWQSTGASVPPRRHPLAASPLTGGHPGRQAAKQPKKRPGESSAVSDQGGGIRFLVSHKLDSILEQHGLVSLVGRRALKVTAARLQGAFYFYSASSEGDLRVAF
ncbi:predicted protein [Histoplasma capsulatum G186AR]|uniref:Uncharacterized protein n=1 Tax=Ajellomyces capsulatus (strain G186AR / H82 / ATCC MYA-2454 / RMSCC 2432) TaxID=447093 RepID=C0NET3_AJECG|nr:uncharacterized protein HCBG_01399 [Histoplasma capsulatum G186AR]EEH09754.1 predicted protein [Histoplasma capsulatum G186AR]